MFMLRVVEAFSGIGSQNKALSKLKKENVLDYKIINTIEWDINAIFAYDIIHNGPQDLSSYKNITRQQLISSLSTLDLSLDGREPMTTAQLNRFNDEALASLHLAIQRNSNLISIKNVRAKNFKANIDVFTYSFPCQDLSVSGFFHGDRGGIDRDAENSSSMLWEVERILFDFRDNNIPLPSFLLMENVSSITSSRHIDNFNEWQDELNDLGYSNKVLTLSSENFGIPQGRKRTFMISAYHGFNQEIRQIVDNYLDDINLQNNFIDNEGKVRLKNKLKSYLKTDYSIEKYKNEALEQIPNDTPSRRKILSENPEIINKSGKLIVDYVRTLTTKQDRHPNSGIIRIDNTIIDNNDDKSKFRYLTPRESFLLMGFDEEDFDRLINNDVVLSSRRNLLTNSKLTKMAGNSIVVDVIKEVFREINNLKNLIEDHLGNI